MGDIRPALMTNDPFSYWARSVQEGIEQRQLAVSSDFLINSTPNGSHITLHPKLKYSPSYTSYDGEWHPTASYAPGDIIRVLPGRDYLGISGSNPHSIPWVTPPITTTVGSLLGNNLPPSPILNTSSPILTGFFKMVFGNQTITQLYFVPKYVPIPGTYVCTTTVPSLEMFLLLTRIQSGGCVVTTTYLSATAPYSQLTPQQISNIYYFRMWDINYFPAWPELPTQAVVNPYSLLKTYGRYWDLMSLLPSTTFACSTAGAIIQFTDAQLIPSGSANYTGSYTPNN